MIGALTLLLVCQLAGETLARALGLPIPGPVIGMLILLGWLTIGDGVSDDLGRVADALLGNLSLLFVPAGVGVMVHWDLLRGQWLAIVAALLIGTPVAVAVTALVMAGARRLTGGGRGSGGADAR